MSKRKGSVTLAACACLAIGGFMGISARAADTADDNGSFVKPVLLDEAPPANTSVINEGINRAGAGKFLADTGIKVGGWVEGSYEGYNFNHPNTPVNSGRVFDFENNEFRLNQIELNIGRAPDVAADAKAGKWDWGFMVDMMYGSDGRLIHANGLSGYNHITHPINQFDLTQAYGDLIIPVGNGLDIRFGKFVTPFGYETIAPTANPLYSHSYSFGFGIPFTHTGVLGIYNVNEKLSVTGGITRGWDQATDDNNGAIDFLGSATYTVNKDMKIVANASIGPQQFKNCSNYRYEFEGIVNYTPSSMTGWSFGLDALLAWEEHATTSNNTAHWYGATAYAGYKISDMWTVNGRGEWFRDEQGTRLGIPNANFYEVTLGLTIHPFPTNKWGANLVIRPEVRYDYCNHRAFAGGTGYDQTTAAVDAIFSL